MDNIMESIDKYEGDTKNSKYHGIGVLTYSNGNKYIGEFRDGKKHGKGTYIFVGGGKYIGDFKDDEIFGQGISTYSNGNTKYIGGWKNGYFHGQGILTSKDGTINKSEWENGKDIKLKVFDSEDKVDKLHKSINHPIFDIQARVQVKSIDINKGKWTRKRDWQELIVEFKDGTILNKVRHKPYNFDVKVGQEIIIIWLVPNNDNSSWYYTKSKQTDR